MLSAAIVPFACAAVLASVTVGKLLEAYGSIWDVGAAGPDPETQMRAVAYGRHAMDRSVLEYSMAFPRPLIRPNQCLIHIQASSLNPLDYKMRRNWVPHFLLPKPKIAGHDVAGIVVQVGRDVRPDWLWQVGDRVAAMLPQLGSSWGAAADYVAVRPEYLARIPDTVTSWEEAASLPLVALTVQQGFSYVRPQLKQRGEFPKPRVLIQAGAGGVGTYAVQYAKHVLGWNVTATASPGKMSYLFELGADQVLDYRTSSWERESFDVVLDPVSWLYERRTLQQGIVKPDGHYINIGSSSPSWELGREQMSVFLTTWNWLYHKTINLFRRGLVPNYDIVVVRPHGAQLQTALDLLGNGTMRAVIDKRYRLADYDAAYEYLEQGHATGKVVLYHYDENLHSNNE